MLIRNNPTTTTTTNNNNSRHLARALRRLDLAGRADVRQRRRLEVARNMFNAPNRFNTFKN